jgi:hypothetical protein
MILSELSLESSHHFLPFIDQRLLEARFMSGLKIKSEQDASTFVTQFQQGLDVSE